MGMAAMVRTRRAAFPCPRARGATDKCRSSGSRCRPSLARAREVQRAGQLSEIGKFSLPLPRAREVQLPMLHAPPPIPCQIAPRA